MKNEMQLNSIELIFRYNKPSGEEVVIKGQIDEEGQWEQWGASKEELSDNVAVIEAIQGAISEFLIN